MPHRRKEGKKSCRITRWLYCLWHEDEQEVRDVYKVNSNAVHVFLKATWKHTWTRRWWQRQNHQARQSLMSEDRILITSKRWYGRVCICQESVRHAAGNQCTKKEQILFYNTFLLQGLCWKNGLYVSQDNEQQEEMTLRFELCSQGNTMIITTKYSRWWLCLWGNWL